VAFTVTDATPEVLKLLEGQEGVGEEMDSGDAWFWGKVNGEEGFCYITFSALRLARVISLNLI